MPTTVQQITERVRAEHVHVKVLSDEIKKVIVGQEYLIERLLVGLLARGHILIEGVPGLAKTMSVSTLARAISAHFQRIQFTPDLLPADLIGTLVYNPKEGTFTTRKGPIFANIVLADEINRSPSKVQSALLEAMQERQVTIGENTFKLPDPFLVLASQNPIEQEGTYPLPEAQVDRFMLKLKVTYPSKKEEREILDRMATLKKIEVSPAITGQKLLELQKIVDEIYADDKIKDYIVNLVFATRYPDQFNLSSLKPLIWYGASPRATIYLTLASKALAFINGRGYVTPDDVKEVGYDILRHRILITYEAEAEEMSTDDIIAKIFDQVEVP